MSRNRNDTLDIIKLFASYMVVFIHVAFYGGVGYVLDALARFAVPLFFLVSGFYSYKITPDKIKHRMFRLIRLLAFAVLVYALFDVLYSLVKHDKQEIVLYFCEYINPINLLELFVFNKPVHTTHLWYLLASIYVYCIFYFITKYKISDKVILIVSIIALLLHLFLGEFIGVFGVTIPIPFVRNFALMGFPFFWFGILTKKYQHKLTAIPNYTIVILTVVGVLETLLSRYYFGKNELYVGSLLILVSAVFIFIKYPNTKYPPVLVSLAECSTYIYVFHPLISSVIRKMYEVIGFDYSSVALQMIHPLLVCVTTTIFAYVLSKLTQKLTNR